MNALQLEKQKGKSFNNYDTTCKLCGEEEEDIIHFTVKCKLLEKKRNNMVVNKEIIDPEERMKDFLFRNKNYTEIRKVIRDLWVLRRQILKELERGITMNGQKDIDSQITTQKGLLQSRTVGSQEGDTPIVNPPKCGLPKGRILETNNRDIPRVHHYQQEEGNLLQNDLVQSNIGNPPQSGPPQSGLQQKTSKNPPQSGPPQSGTWHSRTI